MKSTLKSLFKDGAYPYLASKRLVRTPHPPGHAGIFAPRQPIN